MPVRVYIVEDHPLMREMIGDYVSVQADMEVCGTAENAEMASEALGGATADVVLVDLSLPGRSGLDLVEEIQERWGTPCVILSGHGERTYVARALASGAGGYVLKGNSHELPLAIARVLEGEIHLSPTLREKLDYDPDARGA